MINKIINLYSRFKLFYFIKLLSSFFTQIGSLFLIYQLRPSDLGHLALIVSVAQLMFVLTSGWSNGSIINLGSKKYSETGDYKDIVIYRGIIVFISFIFVTIAFFFLKGHILDFILEYKNYRLVFILFLGYVFYDFSSQLLYPGNKNLIQSLSELIATTIILALTFLYVKNINEYVYVYSITFFIFSIFVFSMFVYYFKEPNTILTNKEFKLVLEYSMWQMLSVVGIYVINIGINYILVLNNVEVESIGLYNFSYKLFSGFSPFFALFGILIPKWVHGIDKSILHNKLMNRFLYSLCILVAMYLIIALCLKPFIILIGKEEYLKSVSYFYYLLPAFVFLSYVNLINTVLMNTKYFKQAQFAIVFQAVSLIIFGFPLVKIYGIMGAIFATTLSFIVGAVYLNILYNKKARKSFVA